LEYTTIAEDKVFSAKHLFKSGQILYSKIRPYLAKAVIVDFEGLCSADMYPIDSLINTSYLHRWMISSEFTELASGKQGRTVLPKINQNALNELCVPVPPLEEQAKIVEYVENALTYIHQLMETNFQVTTNLELLNQSILSKAFKGELVEQDPTDEPASVLLERIQKEREKEKKQLSRQVQKNKKNRN
jgi:type I restriction enzyme, S subunit